MWEIIFYSVWIIGALFGISSLVLDNLLYIRYDYDYDYDYAKYGIGIACCLPLFGLIWGTVQTVINLMNILKYEFNIDVSALFVKLIRTGYKK